MILRTQEDFRSYEARNGFLSHNPYSHLQGLAGGGDGERQRPA